MEHEEIEMKMSPVMKKLFTLVVIMSLFFALGAIATLEEAEDFEEQAILILGAIFFGGGSLLVINLMQKKAGKLILSPQKLIVDSYLATGIINDQNFASTGIVKVLGYNYLGIELKDAQAFIDSKKNYNFTMKNKKLAAQGVLKVAMLLNQFAPNFLLEGVLTLLGLKKLPDKLNDQTIMQWNKENWGYHIFIHAFWFEDTIKISQTVNNHLKQTQATKEK